MAGWGSETSVAAPEGELLHQGLGVVRFLQLRLVLRPRSTLVLPLFGRGAMLRGAFGLAFRRLVCHDMALACRACPLARTCPYPEVFEPSPGPDAGRLSTYSDLPRPFVFDPPFDPRTTFAPGDEIDIGLTVVGRAARFVPYFVVAFRNLADEGLGPRRARFCLRRVVAQGVGEEAALVVHAEGETSVRTPTTLLGIDDVLRPGDLERTAVRLVFKTPTELKHRGTPLAEPDFGVIVRRLRDRLSALAAFYCEAPLAVDFRGIAALADGVRLVEDRTRPVRVQRTSGRTGQRHDVGGMMGDARYEGAAVGALMPLLRLGEVVHVGRHAAFGNGIIDHNTALVAPHHVATSTKSPRLLIILRRRETNWLSQTEGFCLRGNLVECIYFSDGV